MTNEKVALITGGSGDDIGRSVAIVMARAGFRVVINYHQNQSKADEVVKYIIHHGGKACAIKANIFIPEQCNALLHKTIEMYGRIDVLYIGPGSDFHVEKLVDLDSDRSIKDILQEMIPVYELIPQAIEDMKKRNWGRIIGMGSNPDIPSPSLAYNVAKNARMNTLLEMTNEAWKNHITINVISPGPVEHYTSLYDAISDEEASDMTKVTPFQIALFILELSLEKSDYITGNNIKFRF